MKIIVGIMTGTFLLGVLAQNTHIFSYHRSVKFHDSWRRRVFGYNGIIRDAGNYKCDQCEYYYDKNSGLPMK